MYRYAYGHCNQPWRFLLKVGTAAVDIVLTALALIFGMIHNGLVAILRKLPEPDWRR